MKSSVSIPDLVAARCIRVGEPLVGTYRGVAHTARVQHDGSISVDAVGTFRSASLAANAVVRRNTNGWRFWRLADGRTLADVRAGYQR